MKCFCIFSLCLALSIYSVSCQNVSKAVLKRASFPPRGWNSYDSFSWRISEEEFLQSADIISRHLHKYGYEYVVVDFLWYRRKVPGAYMDSLGFDVIDEWGRMMPDPERWPSSKGGKGFSEVANKVHSMGLKFGIHVMRGISTQAVNANTPILDTTKGGNYQESDRKWYAKDIAIVEQACAWMPHGFMSVNTKLGAGRAFLRSLYEQYAEWGVDFVKHDCVFGADFDLNEISYVSEVLRELDRPIVYSLSPGTSVTPAMVKDVSGLVNMYRITGDDWDNWEDVLAHFDVSRDFSTAKMIGAKGLMGTSWPDLDMLPFGWLTDAERPAMVVFLPRYNTTSSNEGPHRYTKLNPEEQKAQMTLWAMAKSPLMYGGDVRKLDKATYDLITNPILLEINSFSSNNMEFPYITSLKSGEEDDKRVERSKKTSSTHSLGLTGCTEPKASGWSIENLNGDLERICWKRSLGKHQAPFCVYKRELHLASDAESMYQEEYRGKHQLVATNRMQFCLDGSPKKRLTSGEFNRGSFYPCGLGANQMWQWNPNGTLVNSYSGLCATMESIEAETNAGGIRSWVAIGKKGEVYVAFFNLNDVKTVISAKTSDLVKLFPDRSFGSCKSKEMWSGSDVDTTQGTLSAAVETHGCALLVINCI